MEEYFHSAKIKRMELSKQFPELDDLIKLKSDSRFLKECAKHMASLGYSVKDIGDRICILKGGLSSSHSGTFVGLNYINDVETYATSKLPEYYSRKNKTQEEVTRIFSLMSSLGNEVAKTLINL